MKYLLFLLMVVIGFSASAQNATQIPALSRAKKDTLTNADTITKVVPVTAGYSSAGFQVVISKLSGTVAGSVEVSASLDGANYKTLNTDTLTNSATNNIMYSYEPAAWTSYKITIITSGTVSAVSKQYYVLKRHN